jgi:hypothetical protein
MLPVLLSPTVSVSDFRMAYGHLRLV